MQKALACYAGWAVFTLLGTMFTACQYKADNLLSKHILPVCPDGRLAELDVLQLEQPGFSSKRSEPEWPSNTAEHIEYLLNAAEEEAKRRNRDPVPLIVHIHGGRKTTKASRKQADQLITTIGAEDAHWHYPIFVQWDSGDLSAYYDHLYVTRQGRVVDTAANFFSAPIVLAVGLARGVVKIPQTLLGQYTRDASSALEIWPGRSLLPSRHNAQVIAAAAGAGYPPASPGSGVFDVRSATYERTKIDHGLRLAWYFPSQLLKVPIQGLVLEGLGQGAWISMHRRAQSLAWLQSTFEARRKEMNAGELKASLVKPVPDGALPQLFAAIANRSKHTNYEVTIVAHSMGTIAVNASLRALEGCTVERIIYMAAACSTAEAVESIVPFLKSSHCTDFYYLALHPNAEADEINMWDTIPRGSLLEYIDAYYTEPASYQNRVFGKWTNAMPALGLFSDVSDRVHFKAFDTKPYQIPQRHGDFNKIPFWRPNAYEPAGAGHFSKHWLEDTAEEVMKLTGTSSYTVW